MNDIEIRFCLWIVATIASGAWVVWILEKDEEDEG